MKITAEQKFGVPTNYFSIGAAESEYELNFSVDGEKWTSIGKTTPANEVHLISECPKNLFWKLVGNTGDVLVQW